jgi:hypothetical protein
MFIELSKKYLRRSMEFERKVRAHGQAMTDDLPFKVVRSNGHNEVLARGMNLLIGRAGLAAIVPRERVGRIESDRLVVVGDAAVVVTLEQPDERAIARASSGMSATTLL